MFWGTVAWSIAAAVEEQQAYFKEHGHYPPPRPIAEPEKKEETLNVATLGLGVLLGVLIS